MRDDVGFRSQQFAEQVEQRRDGYSAQRQEAWRSLPAATIGQFQEVQKHNAQMAESSSQLALDEIRRKTALEDLEFTQRLHSDDMLNMQKQAMAEDLRLKVAQVDKAMKDLEPGMDIERLAGFSAEEIAMHQAGGRAFQLVGDKVKIRPSTADEVTKANAALKEMWRGRNRNSYTNIGQMIRDYGRIVRELANDYMSDEERKTKEGQRDWLKKGLADQGVSEADLSSDGASTSNQNGSSGNQEKSAGEAFWTDQFNKLKGEVEALR